MTIRARLTALARRERRKGKGAPSSAIINTEGCTPEESLQRVEAKARELGPEFHGILLVLDFPIRAQKEGIPQCPPGTVLWAPLVGFSLPGLKCLGPFRP